MKKKGTKTIINHILSFFLSSPKKKFNYRQILSKLPYEINKNKIKEALFLLENEKKIEQINPGSYRLLKNKNVLTGIIDKTNKGSGYIIQKSIEKDIYVSEKNILNCFDGDLVEFEMISNREAKIINVKERRKKRFVGIVRKEKRNVFVYTTGRKDKVEFYIKNKTKAKDGEIVVIEFKNWDREFPEAEIIKTIGEQGVVDNEIHAILEEYSLPYSFSEKNIKEAASLSSHHSKEEYKKRKDLRETTTLTIDPEDAKDFDDAISIENKKTETEIGIHIADVSHFLKKGTDLDKEAYIRGTSVYLVDRVVPMLPESLSNNLCSLRPNEEKLTFSIIFSFNSQGKITSTWAGKTIINSNHRFSYKEAQFIIENKTTKIPSEISLTKKEYKINSKLRDGVILLNEIAKKLRKERISQGSILFNKKEVGFVLNKEKEPVDTIIKESKESNNLVEEYMLLANKEVATIFSKQKNKKNVYRIHDLPNEEKLISLERIIKKLGYNYRFDNTNNIHKNINKLLLEISTAPEKNLIDTLVIRSMSKAKYDTKNIGHFGLSFEKYTHFTSPIRRYPDIIVHRNLEKILLGEHTKKDPTLEDKCFYLSEREDLATKAERSSIKFMQAKYMSSKINKQFVGTISGIMERGVFIEINKNKCEGFVKTKDIPNDYFIFKEKDYLMLGRHTKEEYRLGDEVLIKVKNVDEQKKRIDLLLIEKL
tara:strand:- start:1850 stop:3973 length:2124 start_codon:yes stop_codon:yes gene_type:complete